MAVLVGLVGALLATFFIKLGLTGAVAAAFVEHDEVIV